MASITTYDGLLARIGNGFWRKLTIETSHGSSAQTGTTQHGTQQVHTSGPLTASGNFCVKSWFRYTIPTLESGVTSYIPMRMAMMGQSIDLMVGKLVNLGSLTLGDGAGAASSFADGSAMPTHSELGASIQTASPALMEVTTVLSATPGAFTVTYVDQDGNTAETTTSVNLTASAAVGASGIAFLNASDWGVRDITTAARSGGTNPSGVVKFWGMLPLCFLQVRSGFQLEDWLMQAMNIFPLAAGDVLGGFGFLPSASGGGHIAGDIFFTGDS